MLGIIDCIKGTVLKSPRTISRLAVMVLSILAFIVAPTTQAITKAELNAAVNTPYYDAFSTSCTGLASSVNADSSGGLVPGSKLYMLGDSITNGASSKYRASFSAPDIGIIPFINAVGGRSWDYRGSNAKGAFTAEAGGAQKGSDAVERDGAEIAASQGIVVALGSNGGLPSNPIADIIAAIRAKNQTAPIWWVNVVASDKNTIPSVTVYGEFNGTLQGEASKLKGIIDWHSAVIPGSNVTDVPSNQVLDPNSYLSGDGLHPTGAGQDALVALVLSAVTSNEVAPTVVGNCQCASEGAATPAAASPEENAQNIWNYFRSPEKGLSAAATAGLMGNLKAESNLDPQNTQNNAVDSSGTPVPDGPEIPIDLIRGKYGYGLAQWTTAGRQQGLVDFAREAGKQSGDLTVQLDYLWKELNGGYAGVLAVLKNPDVTLDAASDEVILHFEIPESVLPPPRSTEARKQEALRARRAIGAKIYNTYSGQPPGSYNSGSSCAGNSVVIDLITEDTSNIPCAAGTTANGVNEGYNEGKRYKIMTCKVADGLIVNSQISGPVKNFIEDARASGVVLGSSGGGYRDMDGQVNVYKKFCDRAGKTPTPPPYPKTNRDEYEDCPGGAPPGFSNHQMGLAIDFSCDGALIPQLYSSAKDNPCFIWLTNNASKYGFYEFGKGSARDADGYEGWHWSVDGT